MRFKDRKVGLLAAPGFDDFQVLALARLLRHRDAEVMILGVGEGSELALYGQSGSLIKPDASLGQVNCEDLDALIVPGRDDQGDLIENEGVMTLAISMNAADKPVGAIDNGQLVLAAAGILRGRRIASDDTIREKMEEAGAKMVDQDLVVDRNVVTARTGEPLKHFVDVIAFLLEPAPSFS